MQINIKYNEEIDEFSDDLCLSGRIDKYIKKRFYPAYIISTLAPVFLVGGSIRDLINARHPKDLDFIVVGNEHKEWILEVLKKWGIDYSFNRFGGFKFEFNGVKIDLWTNDDLFSSMQYNVDGLYYDLQNKRLLSLTFNDFLSNGLREINPENNIKVEREKKLLKFEQEYKGY